MKDIELKDGDLNVENGVLQTVEKTPKLQQQLLKIIITTINFYLHPNYGSEVMNMLGAPYRDLESSLKATIRQALDYFIKLQAQGITFDIYDSEEILYKILYLHVKQVSGDPRGAIVKISALDGTHKNVTIEQTFVS
jgi:hypothetical protein